MENLPSQMIEKLDIVTWIAWMLYVKIKEPAWDFS